MPVHDFVPSWKNQRRDYGVFLLNLWPFLCDCVENSIFEIFLQKGHFMDCFYYTHVFYSGYSEIIVIVKGLVGFMHFTIARFDCTCIPISKLISETFPLSYCYLLGSCDMHGSGPPLFISLEFVSGILYWYQSYVVNSHTNYCGHEYEQGFASHACLEIYTPDLMHGLRWNRQGS